MHCSIGGYEWRLRVVPAAVPNMDADQAAVMGIDSVMNVWVEAVHPERLLAAGLQVGSAWAAALIPRPCAMHAATSQLIAGWPGVFAQRSSRPSPFTRRSVAQFAAGVCGAEYDGSMPGWWGWA
jgi:hypothetical protein